MDVNQRLEAINLVTGLADTSTSTFDPAVARRLIELIPVANVSALYEYSRVKRGGKGGGRAEAYAAGIGNVPLGSNERKKVQTTNWSNVPAVAVGTFNLRHLPGLIYITHMWNSDLEMTPSRPLLRLEYDETSGEPQHVSTRRVEHITFSFPFPVFWRWPPRIRHYAMGVGKIRWIPVKTPAGPLTPA